ncbi:MAG: hypothetical protein JXA73_14870, partial [Acidobacteria bacterium]|nr:hypothetical protein [Acidobacteriota bacterium]
VAAPRQCPALPASRRLASARPALASKCKLIVARALSGDLGQRWNPYVGLLCVLQRSLSYKNG